MLIELFTLALATVSDRHIPKIDGTRSTKAQDKISHGDLKTKNVGEQIPQKNHLLHSTLLEKKYSSLLNNKRKWGKKYGTDEAHSRQTMKELHFFLRGIPSMQHLIGLCVCFFITVLCRPPFSSA